MGTIRMTLNVPSKPWKVYEKEVFNLFKAHFLNADVQQNVRIQGRFSKRARQIDVLVTETIPAGRSKTIVDAKYFNRKVNVKAVDGFAGFLDDVGAHKGILITSKGYSKAALRRAFYCPKNLELDILNFSELKHLQGFCAVPYSGQNAFLIRAPLGWVIDAKRTDDRLASLYQRGLDAATALKNKEFMYINYWNRKADPITAAQLDKFQVAHINTDGRVVVSHRKTIKRPDAISRLRIADVKRYRCLEVTGFLEFEDLILFVVLLTPRERQGPNIRRLESVLREAIRVTLHRDNTAVIADLRERAMKSASATDRAALLCDIGYWQRDMGQIGEARLSLEESLRLAPKDYRALKEMLAIYTQLGEHDCVAATAVRLLRLDPRNPTVFNDVFEYCRRHLEVSEMFGLIEGLRAEHLSDDMTQGNCDYYSGNLLAGANPARARWYFIAAKRRFAQILPCDHHVFKALRFALRRLRPSEKRKS